MQSNFLEFQLWVYEGGKVGLRPPVLSGHGHGYWQPNARGNGM